jgi:molecular chaperone DnaK (HSP70)
VRENEKELEELQLKERINETTAERVKMEASRMMEMSAHYTSTNADLHKSITREKTLEIDGLREKVHRCEEIIRDQKFIISGHKDEVAKERNRVF